MPNCNPAPEIFCGTLVNDSCVVVTVDVPTCLQIDGVTCYRQSEINTQVMTKVCSLDTQVTSILDQIDLSELSGCTNVTPIQGTVSEEFQNVYDLICALQTNLNLPIVGLNLQCLQEQCGVPIGTLGALLQAIIDQQCDAANTPKVYRAILTQTGTANPVATVVENNIGNIVWARTSAGLYTGTLASVFTANKTFLLIGISQTTNLVKFIRTSTSVLTIQSAAATDGQLVETSIEIHIYP